MARNSGSVISEGKDFKINSTSYFLLCFNIHVPIKGKASIRDCIFIDCIVNQQKRNKSIENQAFLVLALIVSQKQSTVSDDAVSSFFFL